MVRFSTLCGIALSIAAIFGSAVTPASAGWFGDKDKDGNLKKQKNGTSVRDGNKSLDQLGLAPYSGVKHAVGVRDFENDAGFGAEWNLPRNLSIMLESALIDTGRFVLVERESLGVVLDEQDLAASGRAVQTTEVARTGQIRPAKYIATGALVEVEDKQSGLGGGFSVSGVRIGGSHGKAQVVIIAKLIDSSTGEIVSKQRIMGKAGKTGLNFGLTHGKFDGDFGGFAKTPVGEAVQDAIVQAAVFFAKEMETMPVTGSVVMVKDGKVLVNRGSIHNFTPGMVLVMTEKGEDLIDPDTGEVLEKAQGKTIGTLSVERVTEKVSYCTVVNGEANPARGTVVQFTNPAAVASTPAAVGSN